MSCSHFSTQGRKSALARNTAVMTQDIATLERWLAEAVTAVSVEALLRG